MTKPKLIQALPTTGAHNILIPTQHATRLTFVPLTKMATLYGLSPGASEKFVTFC